MFWVPLFRRDFNGTNNSYAVVVEPRCCIEASRLHRHPKPWIQE
jgi:hypothetical protein